MADQEGTMIPSESDARTLNNIARHAYRVLSEAEKAQMKRVKDLGVLFITELHEVGGTVPTEGRQASRELSIAQTKAEEAIMWAVKHITA